MKCIDLGRIVTSCNTRVARFSQNYPKYIAGLSKHFSSDQPDCWLNTKFTLPHFGARNGADSISCLAQYLHMVLKLKNAKPIFICRSYTTIFFELVVGQIQWITGRTWPAGRSLDNPGLWFKITIRNMSSYGIVARMHNGCTGKLATLPWFQVCNYVQLMQNYVDKY